jgi:hypothetical protein
MKLMHHHNFDKYMLMDNNIVGPLILVLLYIRFLYSSLQFAPIENNNARLSQSLDSNGRIDRTSTYFGIVKTEEQTEPKSQTTNKTADGTSYFTTISLAHCSQGLSCSEANTRQMVTHSTARQHCYLEHARVMSRMYECVRQTVH